MFFLFIEKNFTVFMQESKDITGRRRNLILNLVESNKTVESVFDKQRDKLVLFFHSDDKHNVFSVILREPIPVILIGFVNGTVIFELAVFKFKIGDIVKRIRRHWRMVSEDLVQFHIVDRIQAGNIIRHAQINVFELTVRNLFCFGHLIERGQFSFPFGLNFPIL